MEYQTFCKNGDDEELYEYFKQYGIEFFKSLGLPDEKLRYHDHEKLAHYAKSACDIEYFFPFGWGEINGTHNRTDFDLLRHQQYSGRAMEYFDEVSKEKYIPYIVESTYGLDRLFLSIMFESIIEEELEGGDTRLVFKIIPALAPVKVNVLPLVKKHHAEKAKEIYNILKKQFVVTYDEAGNIGKRYRRGDAIGTPFTVTIDDNTLEYNIVTLRDRDTMGQINLDVNDLSTYISEKIKR